MTPLQKQLASANYQLQEKYHLARRVALKIEQETGQDYWNQYTHRAITAQELKEAHQLGSLAIRVHRQGHQLVQEIEHLQEQVAMEAVEQAQGQPWKYTTYWNQAHRRIIDNHIIKGWKK